MLSTLQDSTVSAWRKQVILMALLSVVIFTVPSHGQFVEIGGALAKKVINKRQQQQQQKQQASQDADAANTSAGLQAALDSWKGQPKIRLAVMDLNGTAFKTQTSATPTSTTSTIVIPPPADFARGLTEMLTTSLLKTDRFVVLERAALDKVVSEQDLAASGRVNADFAPAKGKIIGAQAVVFGDITQYKFEQSSMGGKLSVLKGLGGKVDRVTALVGIDIRIIDAATGQILASQHASGNASISGVSADFTKTNQTLSAAASISTPLGQASRQALDKAVVSIVNALKKQPWSARILDVRQGRVYINAGKELGIAPGMEFEVYDQGEFLTDPDSGQSLGSPESKLGLVKVSSVDTQYCVATAINGAGFKRANVVRLKGSPAKE